MERNIKNVGGYSGIVIRHDAEFCSSSTFKIDFALVYRSTIIHEAIGINDRGDNDSTLIKLLIPALIFSRGSSDKYRLLSNAKNILNIQNFYVEI